MPFQYLLFNKPFNVLSQFTSETGKPTLAPFVPVKGIYPVGRLDYDSEGLLLLTDDGRLQHRLSDPRFEHPRTYWVQVEGAIDPDALEQLKLGVIIRNFKTKPCRGRLIDEPAFPPRVPPIRFREEIPTSWI